MRLQRRLVTVLAMLLGGIPLVTVGSCDRSAAGGSFRLVSSNDDLVRDAIDIVFGRDDD